MDVSRLFSTSPASTAGALESKPLLQDSNETSYSDGCVPSGELEGTLLTRKGQATGHGSVRWNKRLVRLTYRGGGSVSVFRIADPKKSASLKIHIGNDLPWVAKDVHNSPATFAIEIPTDSSAAEQVEADNVADGVGGAESPRDEIASLGPSIVDDATVLAGEELDGEMSSARRKGKPVRIYFKCSKGGNEKALWLEAFQLINRYEDNAVKSKSLRAAVSNGVRMRPDAGRARKRTHSAEKLSPEGGIVAAEEEESEPIDETANAVKARIDQICNGKAMEKNKGKEYKVIPAYAYPHRWMSIRELHEEMMLPSTFFHDLRDPARSTEEIGQLKVEVLQCVGLPRLDRASDTDAVVYLVCGSSAFSTDVIPDRTNPMWLRKTQRACIFPIYHGYARLYAGVFDDDGENAKDDLAGRVVVDIARLRHSSTYDATMPLRLSTHAYTRRKRGAVRLRFTLTLKSEKAALLSYLPTKFKVVTPARSKPDLSTTIACADPKAFRNIALTVHGKDLPGHFSITKIKAAIKEAQLIIRYILMTLIQEIKDTRQWRNPTISALIFCAWMHSIYRAKFGLVPGYLGLYIMLQLLRSYAIFAVERTAREGFLPPTCEEMFGALVKPQSSRSIESLTLPRATFHGHSATNRQEAETHDPWGRWLFKFLGFLPWRGSLWDEHNLHLEFPYGNGDLYQRISIEECLADIQPIGEDEGLGLDEDEEEAVFGDSLIGASVPGQPDAKQRRGPMSWARSSLNKPKDASSQGVEASSDDAPSVSPAAVDADDSLNASATAASGPTPIPVRKEQDLDWRGPGRTGKGEKLTDTLERISFKLHSLTLHSFHDYAYDIKDPDAVYFRQNNRVLEERRIWNTMKVDQKLDRLLGVNEYSTARPVTKRVATLLEPMIGSVYGFLCLFRAVYNVVTWQDPYLTFLVFVGVGIATSVVFLIPWRAVLFIIGVVFVGPQNWLLRVLRERGTIPPRKPRERKVEAEAPQAKASVFHSHQRAGGSGSANPKAPPPDVDMREVHHVVVPYNQLMYQRFYDWPPQKHYASVLSVDHEVAVKKNDVKASAVAGSGKKADPEAPKNR